VLTCAWHNWKFDGCSGDCLFGGEAVRSHPVRIADGQVRIDVSIDEDAEGARLLRSMGRTLREVDTTSALRDALRLSVLAGDGSALPSAFAAVVSDGARRAPWGFDHPLAMTADLARWAAEGWLDGAAALSLAITAIAEECANLEPREVPEEVREGGTIFDDLAQEHHESAEARARKVAKDGGAEAAVEALLPFVASHLLDYGHGAIYLAKALELAARFPAHTVDLFGSLTLALSWSTKETSLPPWAATRRGFAEVDALDGSGSSPLSTDARRTYERTVLEGERPAVTATVARLSEGVAPESLIRASARAAAYRLFRFDGAWERRRESNTTVLGVTHTVTFAEACLALLPHGSPESRRRLAIQAAAFVGKVKKGDADEPPRAAQTSEGLEVALRARDLSSALAAVRGLDEHQRDEAFVAIGPFAAFDMAVRPIRYAHGIKVTESLRRLHRDDPDPIYLDALLAYVVPRRPERDHRRVAEVARRFLEEGRPPPGLY
jgi:hypothetical protein